EELARVDIPLPGRGSMPLGELGSLVDGPAEPTTVALMDNAPVVGFEITRARGWSEVTVADRVRQAVDRFAAQHPEVTLKDAYNTFQPARDNYHGSMELLYEGALLAVLVVWWFLREFRATLISAMALPLSIIPAFLVMQLAGFSLDTLTLLALALVVGILVDDAIVEVENIVRHLRQGKTPFQAALEAADEIGLAVVATTLTLVAVFLPTAFMGGIPGLFFRPFGMTAVAAILASLLVARLLTPMMCAYLLRPAGDAPPESRLLRRYVSWVGFCLDHPRLTLLAALLFLVGSLRLIPLLPSGFVPAADRSQTMVTLELPPGSSLEQTLAVTRQAHDLIRQIPEVQRIFAIAGTASTGESGPLGGGTRTETRKATLVVSLLDRRQRERGQPLIEAELRRILGHLPGVRVAITATGPGNKLSLVLTGQDPQALGQAVARVEKDIRTLEGVGNIHSSASLERPEVHILPDFARAADLGVTASAMAQAVRVATAGDYRVQMAKINLPERQIPVRVRLAAESRMELESLRQLPVRARQGLVPLESVATVELRSGAAQIERLDRQRRVAIDVELGQRVLGDVLAEINRLPAMQSLPASVQRPPDGEAQRMKEVFGSFGGAMSVGILAIYIVLVLLFHDFLQPFTILAALPLSMGGAFVALLVTHNAFSLPSVIGMLMLMGIVTKNSILLVEYAVVARRERGLPRREALLDACHKRARPIVMTTIAMGAGMLPVAMGWGAEPSFRSPMAIVVIGGLLTSTLLSLLVIPVIYIYVDTLSGFIGRRLGGVLARGTIPQDTPAPPAPPQHR
ncbi:MAG: efflux RND transporter permease subunit, partial [Magnetococcus sp. WYHC-3]